jgi:pilus assembly protein CpaE
MLTVGIASADAKSSGSMHACLVQTGLVKSVAEWVSSSRGNWQLGPEEPVPDVVVLDLALDPDPYFAFATRLRKLRPTIRIVACSSLAELDSELLLHAMRNGVQEFFPRPIDLEKLKETLHRFIVESGESDAALRERLFVVMGSKGGVGTSTVAINLAVQLGIVERRGGQKRVGLLDFGFPLGHSCLLLDLRPQFSVRDAIENLDRLDSHLLSGLLTRHKSGLDVLAGTLHAEEWQRITASAAVRLANVAQSLFDYVVIDFGIAYSAEWKALLDMARAVLVVAEPDVPALWSLERHLTDLTALGLDSQRLKVVLNRWQRRDEEALQKFEKSAKRSIFSRLPNDFLQVNEATNLGMPLSKNHNDPLTSKYRQLAAQMIGAPAAAEAAKRPPNVFNLFGKK